MAQKGRYVACTLPSQHSQIKHQGTAVGTRKGGCSGLAVVNAPAGGVAAGQRLVGEAATANFPGIDAGSHSCLDCCHVNIIQHCHAFVHADFVHGAECRTCQHICWLCSCHWTLAVHLQNAENVAASQYHQHGFSTGAV